MRQARTHSASWLYISFEFEVHAVVSGMVSRACEVRSGEVGRELTQDIQGFGFWVDGVLGNLLSFLTSSMWSSELAGLGVLTVFFSRKHPP